MSDTPFGDADHPRPAPIHPDAVLPPPMGSQPVDSDPTEALNAAWDEILKKVSGVVVQHHTGDDARLDRHDRRPQRVRP